MKAEITTITPEQATKMLRGNDHNRNVRPARVDRYARDMADGNWVPNGEAIVMNGRTLIDGQHRLLACAQAGVPFKTVLVTGVALDAITTIDSGASRSLADVLRLKGEHDPQGLAGAASLGWLWDAGYIRGGGGRPYPSNNESIAWIDENPAIHDALKMVVPLRYNPLRAPRSFMAILINKAMSWDMRDEAVEFVEGLQTGAGLESADPILLLRNQLITNATNHKKMPRMRVFAHTIKAWNAHISDEMPGVLKWAQRGKTREDFPVMLDKHGNAISHAPETDES
jgi:hypothetical protein